MKAIEIQHCQAKAVTSQSDGGVRVSFITPELRPSEAGVLIGLHGKNITVSLVPEDTVPEELVKVDTERRVKSKGERLRAVYWLIHQKQRETTDFDTWYAARFEMLMDKLKEHLD